MNRGPHHLLQAIIIASVLTGISACAHVPGAGVASPQSESNHKTSSSDDSPARGDAARGKKVYSDNCSVCHQPDRAGLPPQLPSLIGAVDRIGEEKARTVIKNGLPDANPPMPPHPDLSATDIDDLIAFLRTR